MAKLTIRQNRNTNEEAERGKAFLQLSGEERMLHLVQLNRYAMLMKGGPLKEPQRKGLVIERKRLSE